MDTRPAIGSGFVGMKPWPNTFAAPTAAALMGFGRGQNNMVARFGADFAAAARVQNDIVARFGADFAAMAHVRNDVINRIGADFAAMARVRNEAISRIGINFTASAQFRATWFEAIRPSLDGLLSMPRPDLAGLLRDVDPWDDLDDLDDIDLDDVVEAVARPAVLAWRQRTWANMDRVERYALVMAIATTGQLIGHTWSAAADPFVPFNPSAAMAELFIAVWTNLVAYMVLKVHES